jgi:hypothetical protein
MSFGIIDIVVGTMQDVESFKNFTGKQKKEYSLSKIKGIIGPDEFEKYDVLLPIMIDFIIAVSKNEYIFNLNKIKKWFGCISQ